MKIVETRPWPLNRRAVAEAEDDLWYGEGIHVHHCIHNLESALPRLRGKRKRWEDLAPDEKAAARVRFELGFLWEEWAEDEVTRRVRERQRQESRHLQLRLEVDRIRGSIDVALDKDADPDGCCLEDTKAKWRSMRVENDFEMELWGDVVQTKSYARMLLGPGVGARVRYRILWINGEYEGWGRAGSDIDRGPCSRLYVVEYSARELMENWAMMLAERDRIEAAAA